MSILTAFIICYSAKILHVSCVSCCFFLRSVRGSSGGSQVTTAVRGESWVIIKCYICAC